MFCRLCGHRVMPLALRMATHTHYVPTQHLVMLPDGATGAARRAWWLRLTWPMRRRIIRHRIRWQMLRVTR